MPHALIKADGAWTLRLEGLVDIFEARALHAAAVEAAAAAGAPGVTVALGEARGLDTAATQVLIALRRALHGSGRAIVLDAVPPVVSETWRQLGLAPELA